MSRAFTSTYTVAAQVFLTAKLIPKLGEGVYRITSKFLGPGRSSWGEDKASVIFSPLPLVDITRACKSRSNAPPEPTFCSEVSKSCAVSVAPPMPSILPTKAVSNSASLPPFLAAITVALVLCAILCVLTPPPRPMRAKAISVVFLISFLLGAIALAGTCFLGSLSIAACFEVVGAAMSAEWMEDLMHAVLGMDEVYSWFLQAGAALMLTAVGAAHGLRRRLTGSTTTTMNTDGPDPELPAEPVRPEATNEDNSAEGEAGIPPTAIATAADPSAPCWSLADDIQQLLEAISKLEDSNLRLSSELDQKASEVNRLRSDIDTLWTAVSTFTTAAGNAAATISYLRCTNSALVNSKEELKKEIVDGADALQSVREGHRKELERVKHRVAELEGELRSHESFWLRDSDQLKRRCSELESDRADLRLQLEKSKYSEAQTNRNAREAQAKVDSTQIEMQRCLESLEDLGILQLDLDQSRHAQAQAEERAGGAEAKVEDLQRKLERSLASQEDRDKLCRDLEACRDAQAQAERRAGEAEAKVVDMQRDIQELLGLRQLGQQQAQDSEATLRLKVEQLRTELDSARCQVQAGLEQESEQQVKLVNATAGAAERHALIRDLQQQQGALTASVAAPTLEASGMVQQPEALAVSSSDRANLDNQNRNTAASTTTPVQTSGGPNLLPAMNAGSFDGGYLPLAGPTSAPIFPTEATVSSPGCEALQRISGRRIRALPHPSRLGGGGSVRPAAEGESEALKEAAADGNTGGVALVSVTGAPAQAVFGQLFQGGPGLWDSKWETGRCAQPVPLAPTGTVDESTLTHEATSAGDGATVAADHLTADHLMADHLTADHLITVADGSRSQRQSATEQPRASHAKIWTPDGDFTMKVTAETAQEAALALGLQASVSSASLRTTLPADEGEATTTGPSSLSGPSREERRKAKNKLRRKENKRP